MQSFGICRFLIDLKKKQQFDYKRVNWAYFQDILTTADWDYVFQTMEVDVMWHRFRAVLNTAKVYAIPLKKQRKKIFHYGKQLKSKTLADYATRLKGSICKIKHNQTEKSAMNLRSI